MYMHLYKFTYVWTCVAVSRSSSTPAFGQYSNTTPSKSYTRMSQSAENTPLKYQGQQPPARKHLAANMGKEASLQSSINIWISKNLIQNIRTRFLKDFEFY